jgi:hypothetical protein
MGDRVARDHVKDTALESVVTDLLEGQYVFGDLANPTLRNVKAGDSHGIDVRSGSSANDAPIRTAAFRICIMTLVRHYRHQLK